MAQDYIAQGFTIRWKNGTTLNHPRERLHVYPNPPRVPLGDPNFVGDLNLVNDYIAADRFSDAIGFVCGNGYILAPTDVVEENRARFKARVSASPNPEDSGLDPAFWRPDPPPAPDASEQS